MFPGKPLFSADQTRHHHVRNDVDTDPAEHQRKEIERERDLRTEEDVLGGRVRGTRCDGRVVQEDDVEASDGHQRDAQKQHGPTRDGSLFSSGEARPSRHHLRSYFDSGQAQKCVPTMNFRVHLSASLVMPLPMPRFTSKPVNS